MRVLHTTARLRSTGAAYLKHVRQTDQAHCESNCCSRETRLRTRAELHCLSRIDKPTSDNSDLMPPSRPYEFARPHHSASDSCLWNSCVHFCIRFVSVELLCPLRQPKKECSQAFPYIQQPNVSGVLCVSLVTQNIIHCLFRRPQNNDRAQISTGVHINKHLRSKGQQDFCKR